MENFLNKIRYDSSGKPIKRTIVGTTDEFGRTKVTREERGFSLRKIKDKFIVKPRKLSSQKKKRKYLNAKVSFNNGFGLKNEEDKKDENIKPITIQTGANTVTKVLGHRFTDENLNEFIKDYMRRK